MENIIEIKNLTCQTKNKVIINKLNLKIKKQDFISLIGPNDSGKTLLIKAILNLKPHNGEVLYQGNKDQSLIRKNASVVFDNPENTFVMDTVYNDLQFTCINKKISNYENKIITISKQLNIYDLLNKTPNELSGGQKQKVALANALITSPKILILDNALTMIDNISKSNIYAYLKELNKNDNITIINITDNIEEVMQSNRLIVLNEGKIIIDDIPKNINKYEKTFQSLKMNLPFIIDLSNKLKLYELIDEIYYDNKSLIDKLW